MLATDALDEVRREVWNEARKTGQIAVAKDLKGARYGHGKNPENLTHRQQAKLSSTQKTNARLYRGYLLKVVMPWRPPSADEMADAVGSRAAAAFGLVACERVQSLA